MRVAHLFLIAFFAPLVSEAQTLFFKNNERWEVNDPFKMDKSLPPKPLIDPKKAIISTTKGTIERTSRQGDVDMVLTKKISEVEGIVWAQPEKLAQAQIYVSRGEPNLALDEIEPVIKFFEPLKKVPGSWWLKASMIKLDALDRLENDAAISSFLENLERADDGTLPELSTKIKVARLVQSYRKNEFEKVITESTELIKSVDDVEILARLHILKGSSLLVTKKYENAMNTFLRVPVFYGSQVEQIPKALLGAAQAFRGMDGPTTKEQKLEEVSNRYLRNLIANYPLSKEAEEAKKLLPKEERLEAEADVGKIKDAEFIPEAPVKPTTDGAEEKPQEMSK